MSKRKQSTLQIRDTELHTKIKLACVRNGLKLWQGVERLLRIAIALNLMELSDDEVTEIIKQTKGDAETVAAFLALRGLK